MTYPIETIISEKFQTIIEKGVLNSRMKDYYDLYYLLNNNYYKHDILREAIHRTFTQRNTDINIAMQKMNEIQDSEFLRELRNNYANKHCYSKGREYKEVIHIIEESLL